jgi:hypothetical protein
MRVAAPFLLMMTLALTGCDSDMNHELPGKWVLSAGGSPSGESFITIDPGGNFHFQNLPSQALCKSPPYFIKEGSGNWSVNIDARVDLHMEKISPGACEAGSLINAFYEKSLLSPAQLVFFPNGPDDRRQAIKFEKATR